VYLLKLLYVIGLCSLHSYTHHLTIPYIVLRTLYALLAWGGFLLAQLKGRINAFLRHLKKGKGTVKPLMEVFHSTAIRSVTCHMESHSVTCYPTQVNTPRLNPSHAGRYSIYLYPGGMEGWVDLVDLIAPRPGVEPATFRSRVLRPTNATTKTRQKWIYALCHRHWLFIGIRRSKTV